MKRFQATLYRIGNIRLNAAAAQALGQGPIGPELFLTPPAQRPLLGVSLHWNRATSQLTLRGGEGPFKLRIEVRGRIQQRWGESAAQGAWPRIEAGTEVEVEAWLRRSAYFGDLGSMLDLSCPLPVVLLDIRSLLNLLGAGKSPAPSLLLLELTALPADCREAKKRTPWLADLPKAERALKHLYTQGWLLVGCRDREQAFALWRSVRTGPGMRARRYHPQPALVESRAADAGIFHEAW